MEATLKPVWQPSASFWRTGLILAITAIAVTVGEAAQYVSATDSATRAAVKQVRAEHPAAALAFREWDDCMHGRGLYANGQKPVFYTQPQCDAAAVKQAEPAAQAQVSASLQHQTAAISAAEATVTRAWPLSALF